LKIVLDTNVFISGIFWSGSPYTILKAWKKGRIELVVSESILEEYRRVASELTERYPGIDMSYWIERVSIAATVVNVPAQSAPICKDPDDDKFILCASAADRAIVISGDKHLLDENGYQGIEVLKPQDFVRKHLVNMQASD
jgi:putative PIN family toxin of toxin-antitoxin system